MKRLIFILILALVLSGCSIQTPSDIVATTRPVYDFTVFLCNGTDLSVTQLITESVSCLHDYSLSVSQARSLEAADTVIISGAGLEDFMEDLLTARDHVIDSSAEIPVLDCDEHHDHDHGHTHETDSHIWLAPENARLMAQNICAGLCETYPSHAATFQKNLAALNQKLDALQAYSQEALSALSCRKLITFHDGFGYMAHAFHLEIAAAVEEESGSEASARELIELIKLVETNEIPAIFVEVHGSTSASGIISSETGVKVYPLDMGMDSDYFEMMYRNIDTLKEALG